MGALALLEVKVSPPWMQFRLLSIHPRWVLQVRQLRHFLEVLALRVEALGCGEKDGLTAVRIWSSRHVAMTLVVSRLLLSSGTKRSMRQLGSMWWDRLLGRTDVGVISRHCRVELGLSEFIFKVHDTLQCMIYV